MVQMTAPPTTLHALNVRPSSLSFIGDISYTQHATGADVSFFSLGVNQCDASADATPVSVLSTSTSSRCPRFLCTVNRCHFVLAGNFERKL